MTTSTMRIARHLCVDCAKPIGRRSTRCRSCSKKGNTYHRGYKATAAPAVVAAAQAVLRAVAITWRTTPERLVSPSRSYALTPPRLAAVLLLKEREVSGRQIAQILGRTVNRGAQLVTAARERERTDAAFRALVERARQETLKQ